MIPSTLYPLAPIFFSLNPVAAVLREQQVDLFAHVSFNHRFKGTSPHTQLSLYGALLCNMLPVDSTPSVALNSDLCFLKSVGTLCLGQPALHATVRILSPGRVLDDYGTQSSSFPPLRDHVTAIFVAHCLTEVLNIFIFVCGGRFNPHQLLCDG